MSFYFPCLKLGKKEKATTLKILIPNTVEERLIFSIN